MALKCCRYCDAPLADGDNASRPGEFCSDDHRKQYQEQIQRETVERLRRSEAAQHAQHQSVLQAGPPPGLIHTPALRGNVRDAQTAVVFETATAPLVHAGAHGDTNAALAALSEAPHHATAAPPAIGHIEKTDNASLSNLLRQARDRIAKDPSPTTTALAVRRKPRPAPKSAAAANGTPIANAAPAVNGSPARSAAAAAPAPAAQAEVAPAGIAQANVAQPKVVQASVAQANVAQAKVVQAEIPRAEIPQAVPVRHVVDIAIEPPPIDAPLRPQARQSKSVASVPAAPPSYLAQDSAPAKPASDFSIDITPPTLAMPPATLAERIPWYVKLVVVLGLAGGGGYYWSTMQTVAPVALGKPAMDEVKPLSMALTDWVTLNASGEDGFMAGRTLTLHKSSMELTNYRIEFVGTVDHRALGWAVRIQDPGNYYAAKLRLNPTSKARLSLIRWKVVDGVPGPETIMPLEMRLPSNDQYTVKLDVRGDQIVTSLQGKVIDRWTDDTFTKGGFAYLNQNTERGKVILTTIGMLQKAATP